MMHYDFNERLQFSMGARQRTDIETISSLVPGCVSCKKTDTGVDREGVDYIVKLRRGADVLIDAKARDYPAAKFWRFGEPEFALEEWSVIPDSGLGGKCGWTLSESTNVDLILFTFDPRDFKDVFLIGFQHLRMAFRKNIHRWRSTYQSSIQDSKGWKSKCMFVPASVVMSAISDVSLLSETLSCEDKIHEWWIYGLSATFGCLLAECRVSGMRGVIRELTADEWKGAMDSTFKPYRWHDKTRVEDIK